MVRRIDAEVRSRKERRTFILFDSSRKQIWDNNNQGEKIVMAEA